MALCRLESATKIVSGHSRADACSSISEFCPGNSVGVASQDAIVGEIVFLFHGTFKTTHGVVLPFGRAPRSRSSVDRSSNALAAAFRGDGAFSQQLREGEPSSVCDDMDLELSEGVHSLYFHRNGSGVPGDTLTGGLRTFGKPTSRSAQYGGDSFLELWTGVVTSGTAPFEQPSRTMSQWAGEIVYVVSACLNG
eukprot:gnl/MRDRNA2_/MRDRNA2_19751_c0_seq1.p1 gnl/MRDRNA2_/MRDRNA2_19751_c0~~gnl/MRDRNA2_/MRDRNA2_19751_c0_seq1.p1  ORF type:complete len:194 (+),score=21.48 gnl/MRDRNA2_/MRDRNA2_19751_c0_seq1:130-711(+)